MLTEKDMQALCNDLMAKRNRLADLHRLKARMELDTIQRETDAYMNGLYDAMKAIQKKMKAPVPETSGEEEEAE